MNTLATLTEEDFLNLPEFPGRQEFRDGELIELPPAKKAHSELVKRIARLFLTVLPESRVWPETGFRLRKGRWIVPDVCVIYPDQPTVDGWFQGAPMVSIEVASRGNTPDELQQKVIDCLDAGASEICVIYPVTHTILVHRPERTITVKANDDYFCELLGVTFTPDYRTLIEE